MKIGVITLWGAKNNYGNVLQCYALQQYLRQRGHNVYLIVYKPARMAFREQMLSLLRNPLRRTRQIYDRYKRRVELRKAEEFDHCFPRHFEDFVAQHVILSEVKYIGAKSIISNPPQADAYITGSDLVWSGYEWIEELGPRYLNFGNKETKRISYAASFGRSEISRLKKDKMRKLLADYVGVSVREKSGIMLCRDVGRADAIQLVDPTMLLSEGDYTKLLQGQCLDEWHAEKRIFCYFLNFVKSEDIFWEEIQKLSEDKDISLRITISSGATPAYDRLGYDSYYLPDMYNWLYSIKEADYVITNSFHGLAFAMIFHKQFSVVLLQGRMSGMNVRLTNLLNETGLMHRAFTSESNLAEQMNRPIDWDGVDSYLNHKRSETSSFFASCGV